MSRMYEGEIQVGARFWWEPDKEWARALVEVTDVHRDGWVTARILEYPDQPNRVGSLATNEESRFREAVELDGPAPPG